MIILSVHEKISLHLYKHPHRNKTWCFQEQDKSVTEGTVWVGQDTDISMICNIYN